AIKRGSRGGAVGKSHETQVTATDAGAITVRAVETRTGLARTHRIPRELFESDEYRSFVRVHSSLVELAGAPPFQVRMGEATDDALSFETLRGAVMRVAQKGISLQRFKGLGEMNADQLRETTMDPETRTLAQVRIEDALEADAIFSRLMGDQV